MQHKNHKHKENSHQGHHRMMIKDFKKRFWLSLIITVPVLVLSSMIQNLLGYTFDFAGAAYVQFTLSSFIYFYGGFPFLKGILDELNKKKPGMMTLIAVAISVAYLYSSATVFGLEGKSFFWELATLIDVMLLGHWIEMRSVVSASGAMEKLIQLMPDTAHKISDEDVEDVKIDTLEKGNKIVIKPGEKVPADGIIYKGESHLNESMLTGESKPVGKTNGDEVIGGTINGKGALKVEIKKTGDKAYLSKVIDMVKKAQEEKSKSQHLADRIAFWLTLIALSIGAGTFAVWLTLGKDLVFALERMASVMVITCPHALGLAIPLVAAISTSVSAQNGLLIRNRTAFENSRKITSLFFDKTGTLTKGEFAVSHIKTFSNDFDQEKVLKYTASVEVESEHPIAEGIVKKAQEKSIDLMKRKDFESLTGKGVKATINEEKVLAVSIKYLKEKNIQIPDNTQNNERETIVYLIINDKLKGLIALSDEIRPESEKAIKTIKQNNIKVVMLTGDNLQVAKSVSDKLGIDEYFAGISPEEKLQKIEDFQKNNEYVAMTGDGVNDAPALAKADIGIAIGSGTDVAAETADIVLVESNPQDIATLLLFGKETYKKMIQNFVWATAYNIIAIPLAAGILYYQGIVISPAIGALFMSLSTVIVAINAQLLKRKIK